MRFQHFIIYTVTGMGYYSFYNLILPMKYKFHFEMLNTNSSNFELILNNICCITDYF